MADETIQPDDVVEEVTDTPEEDTAAPQPEMRVEDAIRYSASIFTHLAWINLGLQMNVNGDTKTDLPQAQLAIDALAALIPLTEGRLDPHEVRDLRNLLSSLQMNFVQRKTAG